MFLIFIFIAAVGLIVGLKVGQQWARLLTIGAFIIAVAAFALYAFGVNYARDHELHDLRQMAQWPALASWIGLYLASGAVGPALLKSHWAALVLSAVATGASLLFGTWLLFALACGLAGECI